MSHKTLKALKTVISATVENRAPVQSDDAIYAVLADEGLLEVVAVKGYRATAAGLAYYEAATKT